MPAGKAQLTKSEKRAWILPLCKTLHVCSRSALPEEGNGGPAGVLPNCGSYLQSRYHLPRESDLRKRLAGLLASKYLTGKDQPLCLSVFWNELTGGCKTKSFQYFQLMMENYCSLQPNQHILKLSSLPGHTSHKTLPTPETRGSVKDLQIANNI